MAIGKKTGGNDFKPGTSGNPNGRPRLPDDIKAARKLNKVELERLLNRYIHMPISEIQRLLKIPIESNETPSIEVLIAKIVAEGIKRGDEKRLGFLLDRLIGPVKMKVSLDGGEDGSPVKMAVEKTDLVERIEQLKGEN